MTAVLTQITEGSAPHLPGQTLLHIDPRQGDAILLHGLDPAQGVLHTRFMLNPSAAALGRAAVAGGIDDAGVSCWQLSLDAAARSVRLAVGGQQLTATLPTPFAWHTVEVGLDSVAGLATLRINGIQQAVAPAAFGPTRHAWAGSAFATQDWSGTIGLDHWVLATAPIGVPVPQPKLEHAGDPRRWLVVYNRNDTDSRAWADAYRDRRGIPYAHLCGLALPTDEAVSAGAYETMRQQINAYLDENNLAQQVVGVLLGLNVPGYADLAGQGALTPIASYLHTDDTHSMTVVNPLYQSTIQERPKASDFVGVRLTGRIDAPSLEDAIAMIDRADVLADQPLAHDRDDELLIDINPDNPNIGPAYTQAVTDWATGRGAGRLRLPVAVYDAQAPASADQAAVVWGWRDAAAPSGFFGSPAGRRALCLQFDPDAEPAVTLRDHDAGDWLSQAGHAGYAYAAAPSRAYALSSLPLPHLFFEALRLGWTVAEAWLVAQPFLRDGLQIVGDPLMPVPFPRSGYDVFGPAPRLDTIDLESPLAVLHAGEHELPLDPGDLPAQGEPSRYLIRRLDGHGRSDAASSAAFVAIESGRAVRPALPAWPADEGWPALQRDGGLLLTACWPASLRSLGIDSVRLVAQADGQEPAVIGAATPKTGQRSVSFRIQQPAAPTRYRFATVQGVATFNTPWSAQVAPPAPPTQGPTILEASS